MNARAERLFDDYAEAHQTEGNRACHAVGIPTIVFSIVLALAALRLWGAWTAAEPVIAVVAIFELFLDVPLGLVFLAFALACDFASREIVAAIGPGGALAIGGTLFAIGWVFQLVGHSVYEKNRPAFARNLRHLLIGPLWIARKLL